jgi:hypothetical protein
VPSRLGASGVEVLLGYQVFAPSTAYGLRPMAHLRLEFGDNGSFLDIEADDIDDDGEWISLYNYASWRRSSRSRYHRGRACILLTLLASDRPVQ